MSAARGGDEDVMDLVLASDRCGDVSRGNTGHTALHVAAEQAHFAAVGRLLAAGADVGATAGNGRTVLMSAALGGDADVMDAVLASDRCGNVSRGDDTGYTALHEAAERAHAAAVGRLLAAGADVGATAGNGATVLMSAALGGDLPTTQMIVELSSTEGLNAASASCQTALSLAALGRRQFESSRYEDVVRLLLRRGGDPGPVAALACEPLVQYRSSGICLLIGEAQLAWARWLRRRKLVLSRSAYLCDRRDP